MVRPAFPGTIFALAATAVLVVVTVSTPIWQKVYFLSADLSVSVSSVSLKGLVKLGTFGYCVEGIGNKAVCEGPRLGYELDSDQIFGSISNRISLPNTLIKWLTYALGIAHPVSAGLAGLAFIFGVVSHFREFSRSRTATWFASIGTTAALLTFVFDMVLFSIAKSRINSAGTDNVGINAQLGNGVWLALAGFILLLVSSILFGCGGRMMRNRPDQAEKERMRPRMDYDYAASARKDAEDLEKAEASRRNGNGSGGGSGLPAFPEEEVPLTSVPRQHDMEEQESDESATMQNIQGVGTGYRREAPISAADDYGSHQVAPQQQRENTPYRQNTAASAAVPFVSMYDTPDPYARNQYGDPNVDTRSEPYPPHAEQSDLGYANHAAAEYRSQMPIVTSPASMAGRSNGQAEGVYGQVMNPYRASPTTSSRSPTYPPPVQHYSATPAPPTRTMSPQGYHQQQQQQQAPWIPPVETGTPITLSQGQSSFYDAAQATTRSRQSAAGMPYGGSNSHRNPSATASQHRSQYSSSTSQPQVQRGGGYDGPLWSTGHVQSPPYDVYEHYQTDSPQAGGYPQASGYPQHHAAPASIPYVPEQSHTPAPTYGTQDPYPSYGGNVAR